MKVFELKEEHVALLKKANVDDPKDYWDGININSKRPFGNSDIIDDMAKIVGKESFETDDGHVWPKGTTEEMANLFLELGTALQIILSTGSFQPGKYTVSDYGNNWKLTKE